MITLLYVLRWSYDWLSFVLNNDINRTTSWGIETIPSVKVTSSIFEDIFRSLLSLPGLAFHKYCCSLASLSTGIHAHCVDSLLARCQEYACTFTLGRKLRSIVKSRPKPGSQTSLGCFPSLHSFWYVFAQFVANFECCTFVLHDGCEYWHLPPYVCFFRGPHTFVFLEDTRNDAFWRF